MNTTVLNVEDKECNEIIHINDCIFSVSDGAHFYELEALGAEYLQPERPDSQVSQMLTDIRDQRPIRMTMNWREFMLSRLENINVRFCKFCNHSDVYDWKDDGKIHVMHDGYHTYCRVCRKCNKRAIVNEELGTSFVDDVTGKHLSCEFRGREITLDEINKEYYIKGTDGDKLPVYEID